MPLPSKEDEEILARIRANVEAFMVSCAARYAAGGAKLRLLDIAPQDHAGARPFFPASVTVETLDIDPAAGATYTADICADNSALLPGGSYDIIVCTEVLEHTLQPFNAVREIHRLLKSGGLLLLSVPFNFRIHGPLPDCWRFTEHGLRAMLTEYDILELSSLENPARPLAPLQYTVVAVKKT